MGTRSRRETEPDWHLEIQEETQEELSQYGTVEHCFVDKNSAVRLPPSRLARAIKGQDSQGICARTCVCE